MHLSLTLTPQAGGGSRNTGAGILNADAVNGVKMHRLMMCSDQIHFLCFYYDLLDRAPPHLIFSICSDSRGSAGKSRRISTNDLLNLPSSRQDEPTSDEEEGGITTQFIPPSAATSSTPASAEQAQKKKKEEKIKHTKEGKRKRKKKKRPTRRMSYMRELRELGLQYKEIKTLLDKEFPPITDAFALSESEESDSDLD
ncbi:uncharacterized protein VP01_581g1 [Puccinia sorghi]|uniref:Uncharacterized protein n=1 Tax=Puccinia sorghi TaxID=27349 RepID=A0A0L6UI30_9BASI|nr:uncharacterized protein VP01_581g1 [Puccinia sorghi]